jgi:hypothetical protein
LSWASPLWRQRRHPNNGCHSITFQSDSPRQSTQIVQSDSLLVLSKDPAHHDGALEFLGVVSQLVLQGTQPGSLRRGIDKRGVLLLLLLGKVLAVVARSSNLLLGPWAAAARSRVSNLAARRGECRCRWEGPTGMPVERRRRCQNWGVSVHLIRQELDENRQDG